MNNHIRTTPLGKRLFDLSVSLAAIIVLSPILILIAFVLFISDGCPVIFTQDRPGKRGVPFKNYKFRTMNNQRDPKGNILPDKERITRIGKFLRRFSLDELPEIFNVLRGNMSIVGPRPLLMQYLERYTEEQSRRHEVLPGITGWAQVNGRNAISWEEKFSLDVWYIDHWTFWLDIKIILLTIWKVISGEGISQPGRATMDEFMGGKKK